MAKSQENKTSFLNVEKLIEVYRAKWKWVLLSVVIFLMIGVVYYKKSERMCEVAAQVLISDEGSSPTSSLGDLANMVGMSGNFGSNRSVEDEMVVIKSHSLLRKTVEELGMNVNYRWKKDFFETVTVYKNPPVKLVYDKVIADTLQVPLKFIIDVNKDCYGKVVVKGKKNRVLYSSSDVTLPANITTPYGTFTLIPGVTFPLDEGVKEKITLDSFDGAALALDDLISVDLSAKKTDIIYLSYIINDAAFGKCVLDTLMSNYNQLTIDQKRDFNIKTLQFLEDRIKILSTEVDSTQTQVEEFLGRKDLVSPEAQARMMLTRTDVQEVELIKAEAEYELLNMAIDFLNDEANNTSMLPIMPSVSSLTPLIEGYNALILERLSLETSAKGDNVALKAINARISAVRDNLLTALNKQSETSNFTISELRRQYDKAKDKLETIPGIEREFTNIMRQQTLKEQLYVYLLRQREETDMAIAGAHPRGVIVDTAFVTDAVIGLSPKMMLMLFFVLGLIFPCGIILLKWTLSKKISIIDQAIELSGNALIARVPLTAEHEPVVLNSPESPETSRIRLLRGNLLSLGLEKCAIALTSTGDSHNSAIVATNLALSMANTGRRTVIVDANIFDPGVELLLHIKPKYTVQSYIETQVEAADELVVIGNETMKLDVISCERDVENGADVIASLGFKHLLAQLKDTYDVVIVNAPGVKEHFATVETINNMVTIMLSTVEPGVSKKEVVKHLSVLKHCTGGSYLVEIK